MEEKIQPQRPEPKVRYATPVATAEPQAAPKVRDPEEFVTFVRRNWGTPDIPANKRDYVDKYEFRAGVARNVLYKHAEAWLKRKTVGGWILDADATIDEIAQLTGRDPRKAENIAEAIRSLAPEELLAQMGPQSSEDFARKLLALATARTR